MTYLHVVSLRQWLSLKPLATPSKLWVNPKCHTITPSKLWLSPEGDTLQTLSEGMNRLREVDLNAKFSLRHTG